MKSTILIIALTVIAGALLQPNYPAQAQTDEQLHSALTNNVVAANNLFASDLYQKYKAKEGNIFFSPYSIISALTMTYEGAKGKTAEEMQAVLHLSPDKDKIRSGFRDINDELNKADKTYKLSTANALWAQYDYSFVDDYFKVVSKYYNGHAANLDFKTETEKSRVTINKWIEDKTNDRIKELIPQGMLDFRTKLVLTNAIYFKADWEKRFDSSQTRNGKFKIGSGKEADTKFMNQTSYFNYGETSGFQLLEMDYKSDDISMLVILPKEDLLNKVEKDISKDKLVEWKNNMKIENVNITLPKFKFETTYYMAHDLSDMGMPTAFKFPDADFTGMSLTKELYISQVIHKTFIEVAEAGTEAAAATAVIIREGLSGLSEPEQPLSFIADHPFIFIIQQKHSGNILFIGRLSNPAQAL